MSRRNSANSIASRRLAPGWPDDPSTTAEARRDPSVFAHKSVGQVTEHYADVIRGLDAQWSEGLSPWKLVERDGRGYRLSWRLFELGTSVQRRWPSGLREIAAPWLTEVFVRAGGNVVNMREIEPGLHEGRHAAHHLLDALLFVKARDDDRDLEVLVHANGGERAQARAWLLW